MYSARTFYYFAATDREYHECLALAETPAEQLLARDAPLIYAVRDQKVIGWLGSDIADDGIVILGPFVATASLKRKVFLLMRLVESFERLLPLLGVKGFAFWIPAAAAEGYVHSMQRLCGMPFVQPDGSHWYTWNVGASFHRQETN